MKSAISIALDPSRQYQLLLSTNYIFLLSAGKRNSIGPNDLNVRDELQARQKKQPKGLNLYYFIYKFDKVAFKNERRSEIQQSV